MGENRFPKSVSLGDRAVAWVESEIEDWMHERLSLRDDQPINPVTNPDTNK
ncbi:MAG: prophage regulatory protein [Oceanospirillaceae bacterium]|jgi:prophage regulatory protein